MGNPLSFDQNYGLNTTKEKTYLQTNTVENLKKEFGGDLKKLEKSIIVNYHTENLNKLNDTQISKIKEATGERYNQLLTIKAWGSEGIAALQILAIVCVERMNNKDVAKILADQYIKSDSVDGILWPNTLFLLKEISKTTLWWDAIPDWNGVIDFNNYALFTKMVNICWHDSNGIDNNNKNTQENQLDIINAAISSYESTLQHMDPNNAEYSFIKDDLEKLKKRREQYMVPSDTKQNQNTNTTDIDKQNWNVSSEEQKITTALASVQLSDGKEKWDENINSFDEIYSFLENTLSDYLPKKSPKIKTWERKFTLAVKKNKSEWAENPYLAWYKQLLREQETQLSFDAKVCYTKLLLSAFREKDKNIRYDATYNVLKEMSPDEWNIVTKGVDIQPMIQIIQQDVKFQKVPNHDKIPLSSFQDILHVYNVALDNYRKDKEAKEQVHR